MQATTQARTHTNTHTPPPPPHNPPTHSPHSKAHCCDSQGLPEAEASGEVFKYSCQARSRLESTLELRLEGLGKLTGTETFSHDLTIPASKQSALKNALQLVPQFGSITDPSQPLR